MKKNLKTSLEHMKRKSILVDSSAEEKACFFDGTFYSSYALQLTNISKTVIDTPLLKVKNSLFTRLTHEQKEDKSIYCKIKKHRYPHLVYIETPTLGRHLYNALTTDLEKFTSYFSCYKFNPYLEAFLKARNLVMTHLKLGDDLYFIKRDITQPVSLKEAKLIWRICHLAIQTMKSFSEDKRFITAVNDFEKPVRQNAKRLHEYLRKLTKKHPSLVWTQQNITLTNSINFSEDEKGKIAHETALLKHARLHLDPGFLPSDQTLHPRHALYKILQNARTAHIKNIQKHSRTGSLFAGYVWKLSYNGLSSWSYDLVIFFDISSRPDIAESDLQVTCDQLWLQLCKRTQIVRPGTVALGLPPSPDTDKNSYADAMQNLVSNLIRTDYLLRVDPPDKGRIFGKGQVSK